MSRTPAPDPHADTVAAHESGSSFELGSLDLADERPEHAWSDRGPSTKLIAGVIGGGLAVMLLVFGLTRSEVSGNEAPIDEADVEAAPSPIAPRDEVVLGSGDDADASAVRDATPAALAASADSSPSIAPAQREASEGERLAAAPAPPRAGSSPAADPGPAGSTDPSPPTGERPFEALPSIEDDSSATDEQDEKKESPREISEPEPEPPAAAAAAGDADDEVEGETAMRPRTEEPAFAPDASAPEEPRA